MSDTCQKRHRRGHPPRPLARAQPWPLDAWPHVPARFVVCQHDRFIPADFVRDVVHERLGIEPDEPASGHLPALSQPAELVRLLERFRASVIA
jgi:pimeloyl-ACP methyl ester carboxylesterase